MVDYELPTTIPQSGQLSPDQFAQDPMQTDPTLLDALTAPFNLQSQFTMGRQGLDRIFLETQAGQGDLLPIEEANKEYGLNSCSYLRKADSSWSGRGYGPQGMG